LLQRARQHDPQAWVRLTRLYGPCVYRWARQAGLQATDAADIVQEVFRALALNLADFRHDRPADSFRGWLWTITRHKVLDRFRWLEAQPRAIGGSDFWHQTGQLPADLPAEPNELPATTLGQVVRTALELVQGEFAAATWQAFWLSTVDQQPPAEVAQRLGVSPWAVYKARSRVLARLRQELDGLLD
jgi:RNA polymerase sigma-70 factor (ECF subfamily)